MPVYFGVDPPRTQRGNTTRVSEALEKKGIKLIRVSPSELNILCFPTVFSPVLAFIFSFFSTLVCSLARSASIGTSEEELEVSEPHPNPIPINLPPLAVALRSANDKGHDFLTSNGFELVSIQGKDVYLNGSITKVQLQAISEESSIDLNRVCYAPVGFCNLSSMSTALDLIAFFSFAIQVLGLGIHGGNSGSEEADDYDEATGDDSMDTDDLLDQARIFNGGTYLPALFQKAATCKVDVGRYCNRQVFYSPDDIPNTYTGFLFRYVKELAIDDQRTVPSFIHTFLLRNLGNSIEQCAFSYHQLCSSWGNLRDTTFGLEMTHIAKCLFLTLDLHGSAFPLFDAGFYEGCLVRCSNASLSINGNLIHSLDASELVDELANIATHKRSLHQIALLAIREGALAALGPRIEACKTMVELRSILLEAPISEGVRTGILSIAPYLRFPARSWSINAKTMEHLCEISTSLSNLETNHPISFRALLSTDPIEVAMSCFDDRRCPSLLNASGTAIDLKGRVPGAPSQGSGGDRQKGKQRVSDAAWTFTIRRTTFEEAVSDFRKLIVNAEARSVSSSSARGTGAVVFRRKQFVDLFVQLQKVVSAKGKLGPTPVVAMESNSVSGGANSRNLRPSLEPPAKRMRF